MTTYSTCLCSTLLRCKMMQTSTPELVVSAYLAGNEKWLSWNRPFLFHGFSWSFEGKRWRYWLFTLLHMECKHRSLTSRPYASVSPFSVGCEYSTSEHCMDRRVGNCTAVSAWQVTNTSSLILLCPLFPQHWLNSRMKWREAHAAHRHSLTSLQSSSELKHGINQLFAIKHNWFKTVKLSLHRLWYY